MARLQLTGRTAALAGVGVTAAMLFCAWWFGLREPPLVLDPSDDAEQFDFGEVTPPNDGVRDESGARLIAAGDPFPHLDPKGWLNGPRILPAESPSGITVIDVWNELCTVCHEAAPGLLRLHEKYAPRGVNFVGLTSRSKFHAESFVGQQHIKWPNGYGIQWLRSAAPQVFLVDREGKILWCDERLRHRHQADRFLRELDEAIDHALAGRTESVAEGGAVEGN
ncbi:MAG TPA: TlpA disulfide reductase family protein [Pirellulales bacterium]|jgi:thiol-disulfide isomerase/thioredoxin|nr:TlpA disulfide reductase family protein [Pirellulales bacterium]